jgi:hypothetical protein
MRKNFQFYEKLIKGENEVATNTFWDLIVITAINERQKECYQRQVNDKLNSSKLPKQFKYEIISDPCGSKIGSGGSTLNVLLQLFESYGDELFKMKILLVIFLLN